MVEYDSTRGTGSYQPTQPTFDITHEPPTGETLLAGFSAFGLAGLTAVDYLVDQLDLEETGHIAVDQLPAITPFENGIARHHTRLFSTEALDLTVLVGDLFVPVFAADAFSTALLDWADANAVDEIAVLSGIPTAHGPDGHRVFYVASEDYKRRRLDDTNGDADAGENRAVRPMEKGFIDGVNARLMARGIDTDLATGVLVTPVHSQAPDVDAALRLIEAVRSLYDLGVDTGPLETFATDVERYYDGLRQHLDATDEEQRPYDRMYM